MNVALHDIQNAKDTLARNPDVSVDAILNHPHKNWDGEAKMYLQGLIAPSAPQTAVAVAEPNDSWDELLYGTDAPAAVAEPASVSLAPQPVQTAVEVASTTFQDYLNYVS